MFHWPGFRLVVWLAELLTVGIWFIVAGVVLWCVVGTFVESRRA